MDHETKPVKETLRYQYTKIAAKTEIRVLNIWPPDPSHSEILSGELVTVRLEDKPEFEALSYTWGEPIFNHQLHLPTGDLFITENLAASLLELRFDRRPRMIWADAICINQKDNAEKGDQVMLMSRIYREAKCVLVWLGAGDERTEAAIGCLHKLARRMCDFVAPDESVVENLADMINDKKGLLIFALQGLLSQFGNEKEEELLEVFFNQGWFTRLWIVQEILLASRLVFVNGENTISGSRFRMALFALRMMNVIRLIDGRPTAWHPSPQLVTSINRAAQLALQQHGVTYIVPFPKLIDTYCDRGHANDLDLIYALLGLSAPGDIELQADYNLAVEELFNIVAWKYLEKKDFGILKYPRVRSEHTGKQLPTWVPDWRLPGKERIEREYHAATESQAEVVMDVNDLGVAGIAGTMIGVIDKTVEACSFDHYTTKHSSREETLQHAIFNQIKRIKSAIKSHATSPHSVHDFDYLASSLVFDEILPETENFEDARRSPTERLINFETYISEAQQEESFDDFLSLPPSTKRFVTSVRTSINQRTFVMTESGFIGFAPDDSAPGDIIVAFHGAETPFVLRRTDIKIPQRLRGEKVGGESNQGWELVGECYLHGFMNNEILHPEFDSKRQTFFLL